MPKPFPTFHLRMPPELKDKLQSAGAGNGNSLNSEIVERLERSLDPDPALRLAEALRSHLGSLAQRDSEEAVSLAIDLISILTKTRRKK